MECPSCHTPNIDNARFCAKCGALLPMGGVEQTDPLIGQVIKNTFRVTRMLGEGGMGRVYEGEQQMGTTTRKVAIKVLHPDLSKDGQIVARFNRECGTVAELEHPNTIQFFDFGQTPDGVLFIAMEFLEGPSIAKILETTGAMPAARVEHILKQVCGSLNEAHKKGIVHRDLKPENVVLITRAGEEDFAKVLDFGIAARRDATDAKKEQKLTQQGMVLGTPPYMSPEQFKGVELDARSDIYSLGVMAYEMLTGKLPFDAQTPWEWATKHLTERPFPFEVTAQHVGMIPGPMKAAIMRALSKNRDERQNSVKEFLAELEGGAPGASVSLTNMGTAPAGGTAMMAAPPPDLLQAPPPVMGGHQPAPTANEMVVPVQAVVPPPQPRAQAGGGGNKGILMALIGVVGLGVLVGVIALVVKMSKSDAGDEGPMALPTASVTAAPSDTTPPPPETPTASATATTTSTAKVATTAGTTTATTTAPPKGGPTGEEACQKSTQAANNGQIEAAAALYQACQKGGQTSMTAKAAICRNAPTAAQQAGFRNDCPAAKRIVGSAQSVGCSAPLPPKCK